MDDRTPAERGGAGLYMLQESGKTAAEGITVYVRVTVTMLTPVFRMGM